MRLATSALGLIVTMSLFTSTTYAQPRFLAPKVPNPVDAARDVVGVITNPRKSFEDTIEHAKNEVLKAREKLTKEAEKVSARLAKLDRDIRNLDPKGLSQEAWGEAGRIAYVIATQTMLARSPKGDELDFWIKAQLHAEFGDLVHKVRIHWHVMPLDEWTASNIRIRMSDTDIAAQTYGYDIFVRYKNGEKSLNEIVPLIAHEMSHSRQFERYDRSFSDFGYHYFKQFKKANQEYERNEMEIEAFGVQKMIAKQKPVALDANGGGKFYFNSTLKDNDNLLWKLDKRGGYFTITPKVKPGVALDANGGKSLYFGFNNLPNDNILWKIENQSGFVTIVSRIKRNGREFVAWDANGAKDAPCLNQYKLPNTNLLWDVFPHGDGFVVLLPKMR